MCFHNVIYRPYERQFDFNNIKEGKYLRSRQEGKSRGHRFQKTIYLDKIPHFEINHFYVAMKRLNMQTSIA